MRIMRYLLAACAASLARRLAGSLRKATARVTGDLGETTLGVALEFTSAGHDVL